MDWLDEHPHITLCLVLVLGVVAAIFLAAAPR